jgi:hypothetical protein
MLKQSLSALAFAAALAFGGTALAQEMSITVKSYDSSARTIVAEDGTSYTIAEGVTVREFAPGTQVKVMIEEKDGQKVVTRIIE